MLKKVMVIFYIPVSSLFNDISTIVGYLMQRPSLYKNSSDTI